MNAIFQTAAALALVFAASAANGQESQNPKRNSNYERRTERASDFSNQPPHEKRKPVVSAENASERLTPRATDQLLTEQVEAFMKMSEMYMEVRKELVDSLDGSPKAAMGIPLLDIFAAEDFAKATSTLAGATENHRDQLGSALMMTIENLKQEELGDENLQREIRQLAELINSGELSTNEVASKKRILLTVAMHSKDKQGEITQLSKDVEFYKEQLKFLVGLENTLDDMANERVRHVERVRDLLKSEHRTHLPMSLKNHQDRLAKAVFYLKSTEPPSPELPTTRGNEAGRRGTGLESTFRQIQESQRSLTADEEALLDEVLKRNAKNGEKQ